jgi:hypothetical protein
MKETSNAERKASKPSKTYVKYRKVSTTRSWKWTSNLFDRRVQKLGHGLYS